MNNRFDTIILLVGTNPLPNFVVLNYFLKTNLNINKIYLIYSEENRQINQSGTRNYAENIQTLTKKRYHNRNLQFCFVPLSDVSSPSAINHDLNQHLKNKLSSLEVHLNYTGGTKVMGIHVYKWLAEYKHSASFSYLDARNFRIVFDKEKSFTPDLRCEVILTIDEIIELHGYIKDKKIYHEDFSKALSCFKELIENDRLKEFYNAYNRRLFTKGDNLIEKVKDISDELRNSKVKEPLISIFQAMPEEFRLYDKDGSFKEPTKNKQLKETVRFLDGGWLEQYVFDMVKKHFSFSNFHIESNIEIKKPEWGNQKFELDVVLIKGYQLIGISCTTSDRRGLCKSKGFEIFLRTRQIGGDEAKAILVTRLDEEQAKILNSELSIDTGGGESLIVLSERDLREEVFVDRIKELIK
ncbi:DUF1887 family CARF protein [Thermodesulfovibrio sp. 3907-1M]|uniref:DUF1887 family CARF protein n=1 Tax=Thermodesulfovibrio autotrophicus TaxID=3118333 RepID=A0AAU8GX21_9BACT